MVQTVQAPETAEADLQAEALFKEARRRRRLRRTGIGAAIVALLTAGVLVGWFTSSGGKTAPAASSAASLTAGPGSGALLIRPVLCYAPPYSAPGVAADEQPGPLPSTCPSTNLVQTGNLSGVDSSNPYPNSLDPALASYRSTSPANDARDLRATVLLPGPPGTGIRYLVGPSELTGHIVKSAVAFQDRQTGQWKIRLHLTSSGSIAWDRLAQRYFHEALAFDLRGTVQSASIVEPATSHFQSFGGAIQLSGYHWTKASTQKFIEALK
jgi:hypothetical protein